MELVRATEAAALAAAKHLGMGDKELVDQSAVDAMRYILNNISMKGTVVIGEGEKDEAPMLYIGEEVGNGNSPVVDIAVDPVDYRGPFPPSSWRRAAACISRGNSFTWTR